MKLFLILASAMGLSVAVAQQPTASPPARQGARPPVGVTANAEQLAKIREMTEQIEALLKEVRAKHPNPDLLGDVEVYAKAGRMLLEFPDMFNNQASIEHAYQTLDQGIERARQLQANQPDWNQGRKQIHAYYSAIDGAVLPYGVTLPQNYDPSRPTRLYVWLHGRRT